jgi:PAS domain S-box-containing protein
MAQFHSNAELRDLCFDALLEHALDNIYFKDLESRFILVSRSMARWFGFSDPSEIIGRTDADLFAPPHAQEALRDERALIRGECDVIQKEEAETWPDGRVTWVSTVKRPLYDRSGRIIGTFGISRDITEQRRCRDLAEEATRRYAELLQIVLDSPVVIVQWDPSPERIVRRISDNATQLGLDLATAGRGDWSYAEIIHPHDRENVLRTIQQAMASGAERYDLIYRIQSPDGRVLVVEEIGRFRRDTRGDVTAVQGLIMDVTRRHAAEAEVRRYQSSLEQMVAERTRALEEANERLRKENDRRQRVEAELLESQQRYRRLLETVTDYVYTVELRDGQPVATQHGPGCCAVTGYEPEEYERDPFLWLDMVHPEDRPKVLEQAQTVLREGWAPSLEHRLRRKDGSIRWVRSSLSPRRNAEGRLVGYDGLVKDITEQREAREAQHRAELEVMEARQRELMERADRLSSLGLLAAGIAHEINNPLQGMLSHLDAVRRSLPPDFPRMKNLQMVERGIETIAALVRQLLWLGGGSEDEPGQCRLGEALNFVTELLEAQFQKRNVRFEVRGVALDATLAMPRRELVQVLLNLFMNARDAMPQGGVIRVDAAENDEGVLLRVADTGEGIPPDLLGRIFTPFFTTKGSRGTGLGLSVAEAIIRSRGGTITVESRVGEGTTFVLQLPRAMRVPEEGPTT